MRICHSFKKRRYNPYHAWVLYCTVLVMALVGVLIVSVWYFVRISQKLDAPLDPIVQTHAAKIQEMQQTLDIVERVVQKRTSSQNTQEVVQ